MKNDRTEYKSVQQKERLGMEQDKTEDEEKEKKKIVMKYRKTVEQHMKIKSEDKFIFSEEDTSVSFSEKEEDMDNKKGKEKDNKKDNERDNETEEDYFSDSDKEIFFSEKEEKERTEKSEKDHTKEKNGEDVISVKEEEKKEGEEEEEEEEEKRKETVGIDTTKRKNLNTFLSDGLSAKNEGSSSKSNSEEINENDGETNRTEETNKTEESDNVEEEYNHKGNEHEETQTTQKNEKDKRIKEKEEHRQGDVEERKGGSNEDKRNKDENEWKEKVNENVLAGKKFFDIEIKDKMEWITTYRNLISSFRKIDKEVSKTINSEHIEVATKSSIKQHKEFLENEYKNWVFSTQKAISEFKKNIGAQVSHQNEKEFAILSRNVSEDLKEKNTEEKNIQLPIYLSILKFDVSVDENLKRYFEEGYTTSQTFVDKTLQNVIHKLIEANEGIQNIGGTTGNWNEDENNYFMKAYENNKTLDSELLIEILQKGINKSKEMIEEHISWYHNFRNYQNLKNKCLNNLSIIGDQRKNKSKCEDEKKNKIKEWKEKKKEEEHMKQKEREKMKKDELDQQRKMREMNLKKKQMIQEHMTTIKEDKKKKEMGNRQKSVVSEEMINRINERNERILQKKVQCNLLLNEENIEKERKEKRTNQKYTHVQSKLISNTDDLLKRLESTVESIKHIL